MQFNYLGGQGGPRDTLQNALGQRSPVLDAQLDFNKSAFTTGVASAGQTLRQAMQNDQAQKDSVLRSKTAREEGMLNRQSSKDLLSEKLAAEEAEFDRRFSLEGERNTNLFNRDQAEADRRLRESTGRERAEFDRRRGIQKEDAATLEAKTQKTDASTFAATTGAIETKFRLFRESPNIDQKRKDFVTSQYDKIMASLDRMPSDQRLKALALLESQLDPQAQSNFYDLNSDGKPKETPKKTPAAPSLLEDLK